MALFRLRYSITPPGPFGLPDGSRIVIPAAKGEIVGPSIDMATRKVTSHGTLPVYRREEQKLSLTQSGPDCTISFLDNFLTVEIDAADPPGAYFAAADVVDTLMQTMSVQQGVRFSAEFISAEDAEGKHQPMPRPFTLSVFELTSYKIDELEQRIGTAFRWSRHLDARARKALLYVEHAYLLSEHAQTLTFPSPHAAASRALAFLQLFKAITTLLGDPSSDRDYQRRFRELGLPVDFWTTHVAPLYKVRNDEDVAHYRVTESDARDFLRVFGAAGRVFKEAFEAYMATIAPGDA